MLRIVSDASGSFLPQGVARRSYRRPLSPSGSGCHCHGYAGSRLRNGLFVYLELGALVLSLRLFFEKNCCHPGGRVSMWHSHTSLLCCYLGLLPLGSSLPSTGPVWWRCRPWFYPVLLASTYHCLLTGNWPLGHASSFVLPSADIPWDVTVGGSCMSPQFEMLSLLFPGNIGLHFFRISRSFLSNI